jgi:hypothetical protein
LTLCIEQACLYYVPDESFKHDKSLSSVKKTPKQ